jgi:ethanolamine ammonia-lyase large subunit
MVGLDADGLLDLARGFDGLYFETGQGSAVTNGAAEGVDMVTLEARAYGLARYICRLTGAWMIVNDVAGFIGPEVFRTGQQLVRACLEDTVMAKLHGLTMGLDVCATFHMGIEPAELQHLTEQIVERAAPAYLMAVAGNSDPMLGYLTTSFREHPRLRRRTGRQITTPMQRRVAALGIADAHGDSSTFAPGVETLYAEYMKAGGDRRAPEELRNEGIKKIKSLQERGYDLGHSHGLDFEVPREVQSRLEAIYRHARSALYATVDEAVIRNASKRHVCVRTRARDREEYLSHPVSGVLISDADAGVLAALYPARRPQVQVVISDGLNADAVNQNLCAVLAPVKHGLAAAGYHVGEVDVFVENGRVRAGYHAGALLDAGIVIHLIGERPGTGLNTLSAYLTYGRDAVGSSRWSPGMDHSCTTAICGIHRQGKQPDVAADEIIRCVKRMSEERRSGVILGSERRIRS